MLDYCRTDEHAKYGACYHCCERCNLDTHHCHFCGERLHHNSMSAETGKRHWLSDCRPDLVKHEPGPDCTWPSTGRCYAFQDRHTQKWTDRHEHFYEDGPMA